MSRARPFPSRSGNENYYIIVFTITCMDQLCSNFRCPIGAPGERPYRPPRGSSSASPSRPTRPGVGVGVRERERGETCMRQYTRLCWGMADLVRLVPLVVPDQVCHVPLLRRCRPRLPQICCLPGRSGKFLNLRTGAGGGGGDAGSQFENNYFAEM